MRDSTQIIERTCGSQTVKVRAPVHRTGQCPQHPSLVTFLFTEDDHFYIIAEIGVALTSFGALFMLLGVILFFDGALLALGNVRAPASAYAHLRSHVPCLTISLPACGTLYLHRHGDGTHYYSTARGFPCMLQLHAFASIFCFPKPVMQYRSCSYLG